MLPPFFRCIYYSLSLLLQLFCKEKFFLSLALFCIFQDTHYEFKKAFIFQGERPCIIVRTRIFSSILLFHFRGLLNGCSAFPLYLFSPACLVMCHCPCVLPEGYVRVSWIERKAASGKGRQYAHILRKTVGQVVVVVLLVVVHEKKKMHCHAPYQTTNHHAKSRLVVNYKV